MFSQKNESLTLNVANGLSYSLLKFTIFSFPYTIRKVRVVNVLIKCSKVPKQSQFPPVIIETAYQGFSMHYYLGGTTAPAKRALPAVTLQGGRDATEEELLGDWQSPPS